MFGSLLSCTDDKLLEKETSIEVLTAFASEPLGCVVLNHQALRRNIDWDKNSAIVCHYYIFKGWLAMSGMCISFAWVIGRGSSRMARAALISETQFRKRSFTNKSSYSRAHCLHSK